MTAAAGTDENWLVRWRDGKTMTLVTLAEAAGVGGRSCGRERQRKEISGERDEQQKSGGQAVHAFEMNQIPKVKKA
jgi:hypothetical protein